MSLSGAQQIAVVDLTTKAVSHIDLPTAPYDEEVGNGYLFVTPDFNGSTGLMRCGTKKPDKTKGGPVMTDVFSPQ